MSAEAPIGAIGVDVKRLRCPSVTLGDGIGLSGPSGQVLIGGRMEAPVEFGTVYKGETFRALIVIQNTLHMPLDNVHVQIELHDGADSVYILSSQQLSSVVHSKETRNFVVERHILSSNLHHLICLIKYVNDCGLEMNFQKVFKFQSQMPMLLKCSTTSVSPCDTVSAVDITNKIHSAIAIEEVVFVPALSGLSFTETFEDLVYVHPNESFGAFAVIRSEPGAVLDQHPLGRFRISWRSVSGEPGVLFSDDLVIKKPHDTGVDVAVRHCPAKAPLERLMKLQLQVRNTSSGDVDLRVHLVRQRMVHMRPGGKTVWSLGVVRQGEVRPFEVCVLPLAPGIQHVSGVRLVCVRQNKTFDFDQVASVLVVSTSEHAAE